MRDVLATPQALESSSREDPLPPTAAMSAAAEDVVRLSTMACGMPMGVVSIREGEAEATTRAIGLTEDQATRVLELVARISDPSHGLSVVPNAMADERLAADRLVTGPPGLRSLVVVPLQSRSRTFVGCLCLLDRVARALTADQVDAVTTLGRLTTHHIAVRETMTLLEVQLSRVSRARQDLRERAEYYHRIFQTAQGFVWWHRPDGTLSSVNNGACTALGYERDELIGRNLRDFVSPNHEKAFERYLETVKQQASFRGVLNLQAADGQCISLAYQASTSAMPEGPCVMGHGVDISDRLRIEAFNRRLRGESGCRGCRPGPCG